jgi:DNA-binding SARP family transcriptional activator/Tfp pilus assembly protein PilF
VGVEVHAFGPMEISHGGVGRRVSSRLQQVLLGLLVVRRGGVVSVSTLADALWPARPPATVGKSIQIHVHRLRRALADAGALQHRPPGYALAMPSGCVDIYRFEDLAQRGRAALVSGDERTAADLFREAVTLHRGPAFQGLDEVDELAIESQRLDELRLAALEDRFAAELALNGPPELVAELEALVAEHPLRERFRAQLMTALYRAGRKADALTAYRRGRQLLVDELGVEPSEECQALERAVLADDPALLRPSKAAPAAAAPAVPPVVVPRQLPADVPAFTGRAQQLRRLDRQLRPAGAGRGAGGAVWVLEGTAGVGKTALAVRWAHRVADQFPDGQLYVNLRGYATGAPLSPVQALSGFLRALGLPADQVPSDVDEAAAGYRSRLADRRALVLLDNAASAEQVRPLLPGGNGCVVLVTSRDQLAGLVARDGAQRLALDVLPPGEARALLARTLGTLRVKAEPAAVSELVELCGRLPLALRIAAANLTGGRYAIADYLAQVRGRDRLAMLAVAGDEQAAVAAAFDLSYRRLPEPARRMFRLLGLLAGPDVTAEAAAALAGTTIGPARQALAALAGAHLLEEHRPGRYGCHDLLRAYARDLARAYARDLARAEEAAGDRPAAALARLHAYYLGTADAATDLLYPHALRLPRAGRPDGPAVRFPGPAEAAHWLDAELPNLVAAARQAAADGIGATVWLLADALRSFLQQRGYTADGEALAQAGMLAAAAAGERPAYGCALLGRAGLRYRQGRGEEAIDDLSRALATFRDAGWLAGQGAALANLGSVQSQLGRLPEAVGYYSEALAIYEQIGSRFAQAGLIGNLAVVLMQLGRLREAADHAGRAVTALADLGSGYVGALNLGTLGETHRLLGEFGIARRCFSQAQSRYRAIGDRSGEGSMLLGLAMVHCDTGQPASARELARAALRIARDTEHSGHEASALVALAEIHQRAGEPGPARDAGHCALALTQRTGELDVQAEALIALAAPGLEPGGPAPARNHADRALEITRRGGFRLLEGLALTAAAEVSLAGADPARAIEEGGRALRLHAGTGHRLGAARTHDVVARAWLAAGRADAAGGHQREAGRILAELGLPDRSPGPPPGPPPDRGGPGAGRSAGS